MIDMYTWATTSSCLQLDLNENENNDRLHPDDGADVPPTVEAAAEIVNVHATSILTKDDTKKAGRKAVDLSSFIQWMDDYVKMSSTEQESLRKASNNNGQIISFVKRVMKFLFCGRKSSLPPLNVTNLKQHFLYYSHSMEEEHILSSDDLLRWLWDVRPIHHLNDDETKVRNFSLFWTILFLVLIDL